MTNQTDTLPRILSATNTSITIQGEGKIQLKLNNHFISERDLRNQRVDYRSMEGEPTLYYQNERIDLIRHDGLTIIPKRMTTNMNYVVNSVNSASDHIDKLKAKQSIKEGILEIAPEEVTDEQNEKQCITCALTKAKRHNH